MKHTPGPWIQVKDSGSRIRRRIQTAGDKGTLAIMSSRPFPYGGNFSWGQVEANARLIAKAPEMYELLIEVRKDWEHFAKENQITEPTESVKKILVLLEEIDNDS